MFGHPTFKRVVAGVAQSNTSDESENSPGARVRAAQEGHIQAYHVFRDGWNGASTFRNFGKRGMAGSHYGSLAHLDLEMESQGTQNYSKKITEVMAEPFHRSVLELSDVSSDRKERIHVWVASASFVAIQNPLDL